LENFQTDYARAMQKSGESFLHPEVYCYAWISYHSQPELWKDKELLAYLEGFTLTSGSMFVLGLIIGMVMLVLGLNLLDVFHWTKKLQPAMPKFISKHAYGLSKLNHSVVPFLVGVTTFFLPCGFTQSMQIYTLSTGSFIKGGLTMLAFALGTLPVLALVGFSSFSIRDSKSGIFFKTAGLIVIAFALFDIINSFVAAGFIPPIFNF
jgi:sulfite exporter TauE/SafE